MKLMPTNNVFFGLFARQGQVIHQSTKVLANLNNNFNDFERYLDNAKTVEREGDKAVMEIIAALNASYITPFDREDIHPLAHELDEIPDLIHRLIQEINIHQVRVRPTAMGEFIPLIELCANTLNRLLELFTKGKYSPELARLVGIIRDIEHQADELYQIHVRQLFANETNPIEIFKTNNVITQLENIIDAFQKVADRLEGIVLKWS